MLQARKRSHKVRKVGDNARTRFGIHEGHVQRALARGLDAEFWICTADRKLVDVHGTAGMAAGRQQDSGLA